MFGEGVAEETEGIEEETLEEGQFIEGEEESEDVTDEPSQDFESQLAEERRQRLELEAQVKGFESFLNQTKMQEGKPDHSQVMPNPYEKVDRAELESDVMHSVRHTAFDVMRQFMTEQLFPVLDTYKGVILQMQDQSTDTALKGVSSKFQGSEEYLPEVREFMRKNPGLTHEQAFFAVVGPKKGTSSNGKGKKGLTRKPAGLTSRGGIPVNKTVPNTERKSLTDLVRETRQEFGL